MMGSGPQPFRVLLRTFQDGDVRGDPAISETSLMTKIAEHYLLVGEKFKVRCLSCGKTLGKKTFADV
ncbi:unnamed protein product [Nezara viridula]|uniref:Uncharacterized protein n=1 Tax=Nezara viridula TaxID=85310 RepID=A0A9P0HP62_NEZVI|nr:unnamed protein product [Nezara viridula]